jgi:hypothetical protein
LTEKPGFKKCNSQEKYSPMGFKIFRSDQNGLSNNLNLGVRMDSTAVITSSSPWQGSRTLFSKKESLPPTSSKNKEIKDATLGT